MGRQGSEAWSLITGWMPLAGALSAILSVLSRSRSYRRGGHAPDSGAFRASAALLTGRHILVSLAAMNNIQSCQEPAFLAGGCKSALRVGNRSGQLELLRKMVSTHGGWPSGHLYDFAH